MGLSVLYFMQDIVCTKVYIIVTSKLKTKEAGCNTSLGLSKQTQKV